jgi:hypothetical protein
MSDLWNANAYGARVSTCIYTQTDSKIDVCGMFMPQTEVTVGFTEMYKFSC